IAQDVPLARTAGERRTAAPQYPLPGQWKIHVSLRWSEIHLRNLSGVWRRFEEGMFLEAEHGRRQVRWEPTPGRFVFRAALVVAHAFDRDAILRSGEFVHQPVELLVRPQLGIVFDDGQQTSEGRGLLVRGLDCFFR